jgi:hypothetical protein
MEPAIAENGGDPNQPVPAHPASNVFQVALKTKANLQATSHRPVVPAYVPEISANPASGDMELTEDAEMTFGQGSIEDSNRQAAFSSDAETDSQSLALPTQSFVNDTYRAQDGVNDQCQSSTNLATGMDIDVDEDQQPEEYSAEDTRVKEFAPAVDCPSEKAKDLSASETNLLDNSTTDQSRMEKAIELPVQDTKTASKTVVIAATRQAGDPPVGLAPSAQATDESIMDTPTYPNNQRSRPTERSAGSHAINPPSVAIVSRQEAGLRRTRSLSNRRVDSGDVVQEPSGAEVQEPAKRIAHRSTSTSRSGRILPSKRIVETTISTGLDGVITSRAAPLTEASTNVRAATSHQGDARSTQDKSGHAFAAAEKCFKQGQIGEDDGKLLNRHHTSKDPNACATDQVPQQQPLTSMTGNARFQQKLQQITKQPRFSAQQMRAARDAALPPMTAGVTGAINRPFVTPSRQEKEALLDNLISRSSSPSFARARYGHPRAVQVQERRAHTGIPTVPLATNQPVSQAAHGKGTQDEILARDLVFRAQAREVEIAKRKAEVKSLQDRNASLEKINADLLARNGEMLADKKAAIGKARELVIKSQEMYVHLFLPRQLANTHYRFPALPELIAVSETLERFANPVRTLCKSSH